MVTGCVHAGVRVILITGDSVGAAKSVAHACGVVTGEGVVVEGPVFRQMYDSEAMVVLPYIQVREGCQCGGWKCKRQGEVEGVSI